MIKAIKALWATLKDPHLLSSKPHHDTLVTIAVKKFTIKNGYLREFNGDTLHCKTSVEDMDKVIREMQKWDSFLTKDLYPSGVQQSRISSVIRYLQFVNLLPPKRNKDRTITVSNKPLNTQLEEDTGWTCSQCQIRHTSDMKIGHREWDFLSEEILLCVQCCDDLNYQGASEAEKDAPF